MTQGGHRAPPGEESGERQLPRFHRGDRPPEGQVTQSKQLGWKVAGAGMSGHYLGCDGRSDGGIKFLEMSFSGTMNTKERKSSIIGVSKFEPVQHLRWSFSKNSLNADTRGASWPASSI